MGGIIKTLLFGSDARAERINQEEWQRKQFELQETNRLGFKNVEEYPKWKEDEWWKNHWKEQDDKQKAFFKRKNQNWFNSSTLKGFKFIYKDERRGYVKHNSNPSPEYYSNEWIDLEFLANKKWDWKGVLSYKQNVQYLTEAVSHYYILENKLYEQDLTKEQFNFHLSKVREDVNWAITKVISYQESKKMEKVKKEKSEILEFEPDNLDNEIEVAKKQLEVLELQKQIIDSQTNLTKEQLKINDQVQETNLNYINVFKNNKEKENGR